MVKVRKKTKYGLHLRVDISRTTTVWTSKSGVILCLVLSNIFSKSGVLNTNGVEMLKVRKKAKCDLYLHVDISRTTTAWASKSFVIL